mmetsp:Transcript_125/g.91  ORF Transcript_125/g.91 Transcript_125/m.91 type:complete len:1304 (-) Transcript_125:228-4139(-)
MADILDSVCTALNADRDKADSFLDLFNNDAVPTWHCWRQMTHCAKSKNDEWDRMLSEATGASLLRILFVPLLSEIEEQDDDISEDREEGEQHDVLPLKHNNNDDTNIDTPSSCVSGKNNAPAENNTSSAENNILLLSDDKCSEANEKSVPEANSGSEDQKQTPMAKLDATTIENSKSADINNKLVAEDKINGLCTKLLSFLCSYKYPTTNMVNLKPDVPGVTAVQIIEFTVFVLEKESSYISQNDPKITGKLLRIKSMLNNMADQCQSSFFLQLFFDFLWEDLLQPYDKSIKDFVWVLYCVVEPFVSKSQSYNMNTERTSIMRKQAYIVLACLIITLESYGKTKQGKRLRQYANDRKRLNIDKSQQPTKKHRPQNQNLNAEEEAIAALTTLITTPHKPKAPTTVATLLNPPKKSAMKTFVLSFIGTVIEEGQVDFALKDVMEVIKKKLLRPPSSSINRTESIKGGDQDINASNYLVPLQDLESTTEEFKGTEPSLELPQETVDLKNKPANEHKQDVKNICRKETVPAGLSLLKDFIGSFQARSKNIEVMKSIYKTLIRSCKASTSDKMNDTDVITNAIDNIKVYFSHPLREKIMFKSQQCNTLQGISNVIFDKNLQASVMKKSPNVFSQISSNHTNDKPHNNQLTENAFHPSPLHSNTSRSSIPHCPSGMVTQTSHGFQQYGPSTQIVHNNVPFNHLHPPKYHLQHNSPGHSSFPQAGLTSRPVGYCGEVIQQDGSLLPTTEMTEWISRLINDPQLTKASTQLMLYFDRSGGVKLWTERSSTLDRAIERLVSCFLHNSPYINTEMGFEYGQQASLSEKQIGSNAPFQIQIQRAVRSLHYYSLEVILTCEAKRLNKSSHADLLGNESFYKSLIGVCTECVLTALLPSTGNVSRENVGLRQVLGAMEIEPYDFLKISECFVKAMSAKQGESALYYGLSSGSNSCILGLPDELRNRLQECEEIILESFLWSTLTSDHSQLSSDYPMVKRDILADIKSMKSERDEFFKWPPFILRPESGMPHVSRMRSSSTFLDHRRKHVAVSFVFRKLIALTARRFFKLCSKLPVDLDASVINQIWTAWKYCLSNHIYLLCDRHADQLMLCTIYGVCKIVNVKPELTFSNIISTYYECNPGDERMHHKRILQVRLNNNYDSSGNYSLGCTRNHTTQGTVIQLYNSVYVPAMKGHLMQLQNFKYSKRIPGNGAIFPSNKGSSAFSPPLPTEMSPFVRASKAVTTSCKGNSNIHVIFSSELNSRNSQSPKARALYRFGSHNIIGAAGSEYDLSVVNNAVNHLDAGNIPPNSKQFHSRV